MISIRRRQRLFLISGVMVLYAVCAVVAYTFVRHSVCRNFDDLLVSKAGSLGTMLVVEEDGNIELEFADEVMKSFGPGPRAEFFQIWVPDAMFAHGNRTLERSPSLRVGQLPRRFGPVEAPELWNLELPDGRRGRAAGLQVPVDNRIENEDLGLPEQDVIDMPTAVVVVASGGEATRQTLQATMLGLGLAGVILALGTAVLVNWSIRRGMEPLVTMGRRVERMDSASLTDRIEPDELPEELRPIAVGLNRMLERLEGAFEWERRTTAIMAHELRTPIAELLNATEVSLKWSEDAELASETVQAAHDVAVQMQRVVRTLLRISRLETGEIAPADDLVPLDACIESCLRPFRAEAASCDVEVSMEVEPGLVVRTDRDALEVVVGSLLSNAMAHGSTPGYVRCRAICENSTVRLEIANRADSLSSDDLPRLLDPAWRGDNGRSDPSHAGLGLRMVHAISQAAGLDVTLTVGDAEFIAGVCLPRATRRTEPARPAAAEAPGPADSTVSTESTE